jgi:N-acetylneuraminic acid mutarotase
MTTGAAVCPVRGAGSAPKGRFPRTRPRPATAVWGLPLLALLMPVLLLASAAPSPAQETWTPTSTAGAPTTRGFHTAVWTGSKMIVWGGFGNSNAYFNTGGVYDPATDMWTATSTRNAPTARYAHTAVWTGSKMIVWGGSSGSAILNTGGVYDPATNTWKATSTKNAPTARGLHAAVWTGSKMIVWGGSSGGATLNTGGVYDPATNTWTATTAADAPGPRELFRAVWTGSKMIVWGGEDDVGVINTGGIYDPATNTWTATSMAGAPSARVWPIAVWTGSKMIVWSGEDDALDFLNTGGIYDPATDTWTATSATDAPSGRWWPIAIWTGSKMIVWGGLDKSSGSLVGLDTGGIYDPATDAWMATSTTNAPAGRDAPTAVWTGWEMIVWGGFDGSSLLNTGGVYSNPDVLPPPLPPADFFTVTPCRLVDTRNAAGPMGGPALSPDAIRSFTVTGGVCGIPSTAVAVAVNLTAVGATAAGHLTLFAGDGFMPLPGNVYFTPGAVQANNAIVLLAADGTGTINVYDGSTRAVHFVLDVNGYFQ